MHTLFRILGRHHWIRFGIRDKLIRIFYSPETVISKEFETDFFGNKYRGNLDSFIDWSVFFYGAYEREYLIFLKSLVHNQTKPVFIDIGANVGQHSLYMSSFCDEIHSFEPNPQVRERLEEKKQINQLSRIHIHNVGLGIKNEEKAFFTPKGCNQGTGSFIKGYSNMNNDEETLLKVVNGDQYFSDLKLNKINLIKIDVEGYEKYVLQGLKQTLKKYRPYITIEFSDETKKSFNNLEELMSILPPSYKVQRIEYNKPLFKIFNSTKIKLNDFDFNQSGGDLLLSPI